MSKLRTITIDPQFLSMSKKKQKSQKSNIPLNEVKLNSNNIRELLLEKLKQHKKNKKTLKNPLVQLNTMEEQTSTILPMPELSRSIQPINTQSNKLFDLDTEIKSLEETPLNNDLNNEISVIKPDKPYGVLKNGIKPTYKNWSSQENTSTFKPSTFTPSTFTPSTFTPSTFTPSTFIPRDLLIENSVINEPLKPVPIIQELEVKKVFQLGRNKKNRTVSVLLKNNSTRKKIENDKVNLKKTNISTVKNFLKKQNLIKFGTTAPNNLLREIYESTKLCGEITNDNTKSLIHNFNEE
jgi:hypothetical protein